MCIGNRDQFLAPIRHITFLELSLCFAYEYTITNRKLFVYPHRLGHTNAATRSPDSTRSPAKVPCLEFGGKCCCMSAKSQATYPGISPSDVS